MCSESLIDDGIIIVKYGHTRPLKKICQIEASHPLPDAAGLKGTDSIKEMLRNADSETLVMCLLSGGASALLVSPAGDITLDDKKYVTDLLLKGGATINELNAVRKHISGIKGGRLAGLAYPASTVTMILSDVIGDRLDVIASGPTVPDSTTFRDAMDVIEKYKLKDKVPDSVFKYIVKGLQGETEETPKRDEVFFGNVRNIIVGSIRQALAAAVEKAVSLGYKTEILGSDIQGDVRDVAEYLAEKAIEGCLLSGGETTVTVKGNGLGSKDGTPDIVRSATHDHAAIFISHPVYPIHRISMPYNGIPGKGSAFRALFRKAVELNADACCVVDADLRSITPEWIELLLSPVIQKGFDFVAPLYSRHKYDGTITNSIG